MGYLKVFFVTFVLVIETGKTNSLLPLNQVVVDPSNFFTAQLEGDVASTGWLTSESNLHLRRCIVRTAALAFQDHGIEGQLKFGNSRFELDDQGVNMFLSSTPYSLLLEFGTRKVGLYEGQSLQNMLKALLPENVYTEESVIIPIGRSVWANALLELLHREMGLRTLQIISDVKQGRFKELLDENPGSSVLILDPDYIADVLRWIGTTNATTEHRWLAVNAMEMEDRLRNNPEVWKKAVDLQLITSFFYGQLTSKKLIQRRKLFNRLRMSSVNMRTCASIAVLTYDAIERLLLHSSGNDDPAEDAVWIRAHLFEVSDPTLADVIQISPWMPDFAFPENVRTVALGHGVLLLKRRIENSFEVASGDKHCWGQAELSYKVYDPITYEAVRKRYTLEEFPERLYLPATHGYVQRITCDGLTLRTVSPGVGAAGQTMVYETLDDRRRRKRETEDEKKEAWIRRLKMRRWISKWRESKGVQRRSDGDDEPKPWDEEIDRTDVYGGNWLYEILNVRPGAISKIDAVSGANSAACMGRVFGCFNCWVFNTVSRSTPAACYPPCSTSLGGNCGAMFGKKLSSYYATRSVICSELFRQGLMDLETLAIDDAFGRDLVQPTTLLGYQTLAKPIVKAMQILPSAFSRTIKRIAIPWIHQMKFHMGFTDKASTIGSLIMTLGTPVCDFVGYVRSWIS